MLQDAQEGNLCIRARICPKKSALLDDISKELEPQKAVHGFNERLRKKQSQQEVSLWDSKSQIARHEKIHMGDPLPAGH